VEIPWLRVGSIVMVELHWVCCYTLAFSYDYRMIFLFPALIFIARSIQLGPYS